MPNKFHDPGKVSPKHTPEDSKDYRCSQGYGKKSNIDRPKINRLRSKNEYLANPLLDKAKGFSKAEALNEKL